MLPAVVKFEDDLDAFEDGFVLDRIFTGLLLAAALAPLDWSMRSAVFS